MRQVVARHRDEDESNERPMGELAATDLDTLAKKVYALLRDELQVERERVTRRTK